MFVPHVAAWKQLVFWCWLAGITYLLWMVVEVVDRITERITR